ncbi:MAG: hypothetical protein GY906_21810, partial [bacterium]|nr:hypothetical protein [bacterium]
RALPPGGTPRIKGGDTLIIDSGDYQMGFGGPGDDACDAAGAFDCYMPPLPSGPSSELPTRLLGSGWDSGCEEPPELWGSERTSLVVNLAGSSNVEVACLEITDHSGCIEFHSGNLECERDTPPFGDWGGIGLYAEDSANVLLRDLDIHGLASGGIHAGRLQDWILERVRINGNGWVGWDGDISGDDHNLGTIGFDQVEIAWNGCGETWPAEEIAGCWDQTAGGYGDGLGTGSTGGTWVFEDCNVHHNTSDGIDLYYLEPGGSVEVRRTESRGNAGDQLKVAGDALIENSLLVSDCGYFDGWPLMSDHCRGGGSAYLADLHQGSSAVLVNSTLASEGDCLLIAECTDEDCDGSEQVLVQNSVLVGAPDFWQPSEDSCLYWWDDSQLPSDPVNLDWNLVSGVKNQKEVCPQGVNDLCVSDPGLVNREIDDFNGHLLEDSAAVDSGLPAGTPVGSTTVPDHDLESIPRPLGDGTDRGAYEYQAPIFSDGFESGDTSKWSVTIP